MKILVVTNLYPPHYVGGYELICAEAVEAFRARGHEVEVLTSNHRCDPQSVESGSEFGVRRHLWIHGFYGHPWRGIRGLRVLERHNNRTLRTAVASLAPDVVHVWNLGGLSKSLCLTLQDLGVPVVYSVFDHWIARSLVADVWLDWWNRKNPSPAARMLRGWWTWNGARSRWAAAAPTRPVRDIRFPRIHFCSAALRELTVAKGYSVQHGAVIHSPVDTRRFCGEPIPADRPIRKLLYVGRLADDKGVMTALKAMAAVRGRFSGELCVYGRGDRGYVSTLESFVREHQLRVSFHAAGAGQMPDVYRSHDALLFTSEWEEPFALTPLEAMASGRPVIGTTTGGSRELFRHGENALTYSAGDAGELAQRILMLDADPVARVRLAVAGQAEVRAKFAMGAIFNRMERYLLDSVALAASRAWEASRKTGPSSVTVPEEFTLA